VSVGVGANKLTARVATREAKPGRSVYVPPGDERAYLAPWPVHVLPGAGGKVGGRLERLNVRRVGQAAEIPPPILRGLFGRQGLVLHDFAHGVDPRPVEPDKPRRSVSRRTSFDPPTSEMPFLHAMLSYLLARACSWMRYHGLATRGLTLTICYGDYAVAAGREGFGRPVRSEVELAEAARDRFGRLYGRRLPLRSIAVELSPLGPPPCEPALFPDPEAERRRARPGGIGGRQFQDAPLGKLGPAESPGSLLPPWHGRRGKGRPRRQTVGVAQSPPPTRPGR
jgi:DNA polymerase-4